MFAQKFSNAEKLFVFNAAKRNPTAPAASFHS
jgi:hypothetical protein